MSVWEEERERVVWVGSGGGSAGGLFKFGVGLDEDWSWIELLFKSNEVGC